MNDSLSQFASQVRRDILRMTFNAASGHPGGSLGCADFFTVMYQEFLKFNVSDFTADGYGEDVFLLSNGHLSPVWYSTLARTGFFKVEELNSFRKLDSRLQGHPSPHEGLPGIRIASGSLGQGLSVAIGIALSKKLRNDPHLTFVLMGDGELQEGQVWEAAMFAGSKEVDHLIAVVDYNGLQIDGTTEKVMSVEPLDEKWKAFGWKVMTMDGHNFDDMRSTLSKAKDMAGNGLPTVILMRTIMGKGVDFMENNHKWHGTPPNADQLHSALTQIDETLGDF